MFRRRIIYTLFFLLLLTAGGNAQMIREVRHDRNDYLLDITSVLQYTSNKEYLARGEELLERFSGLWESGYFKEHHREKIYDITDMMLGKTMRSYPHFYDFISCLVLFNSNRQDGSSLELWLTEVDTTGRQRSSTPLAEFLEYTRRLFEDNMLYETRSRAWYFRNGEFSFAYDSALYLDFPKLDLVCSTGPDSTVITNTAGKYYLFSHAFRGEKGRISWLRAGYEEDKVYADLRRYDIDVRTLSFNSDSAVFHNRYFFDFPIPGRLSEKVLSSPPGNRTQYPQFESYFKEYEVLGIYENINYNGGIGMRGRKLTFSGDRDQPARFIFKKGGDYFAVIRSLLFELEDDEIVSSPASFSIYFQEDSIYHPGLQMRYEHDKKLLSLIRLNRGIAQSPFFDAYHKVDMYCEALYWVMDSEEISFENIRGLSQESRTEFESDKYYSAYEYYRLQGIDEVNPLVLVRQYADRYGTNTVKVGAFADFIGKPVEQAVSMLLLLDSRGLVVYNSDKREALIKQRLYDYLLAHHGNTDYDVIHFTSATSDKRNAVVELATFEMLINGVPEISLSDSQMVYIYPRNEELVMKDNRDFSFSGRIRAGLFEFYAQDCFFEYDTFMLNMPRIDSMSFFVKVEDTTGKEKVVSYQRVQAMVEGMSGYMMIDKPDNKSGLKSFPEYPVFTSNGNSFVYYDDLSGANGSYGRDEFYYELDPFTIDSLDNYSTTGLRFTGYLATGGILPPMDDPLVVMPDRSLGIKSVTGEEGLPLYDGLATIYDTITMDNAGLHGAGRMQYLNSLTRTSDMELYPDSIVATTSDFRLEKVMGDVEYADVSVGRAYQYLYPDTNLMVLKMDEELFSLYDGSSSLEGSLMISPEGLKGAGNFGFERALIESGDFSFGHHSMSADTSDFSLYTDTTFSTLAFLTNDYRTALDFDQRRGTFISTGVSSLVDIPFNMFICYMDEIDWDMDGQVMHLRNNIVDEIPDIDAMDRDRLIDLDLSGSEFISMRPDQDSLRFFSTRADYDLQRNIIYAGDVKIIRVADAAVFPGDGKLTILEDARIETLSDADIVTDTASRYHHIYDANVNIFSRHAYAASGNIDHVDITGEASPVYLSSISVDSLGRSVAHGIISDTASFMLSPWFSYTGNVYMASWQPFLHFDGSFSAVHDCFQGTYNRAVVDTLIDPQNILIPVPDSLRGPGGELIQSAIMYSLRDENFYPAFIAEKRMDEDFPALSAKGLLRYDPAAEKFTVSGGGAEPSEYLSLHTSNCVLEGVGEVSTANDPPYVDLDLYGRAAHYILPDSTSFELVMGFDFFFDPGVLRRMTTAIAGTNLPGTETSNPYFQAFLRQRMPPGEAEKIISELTSFGTIRRLPEAVGYRILINDVTFFWNRETASFISRGDIGIFSIGEDVVNRMVPGYIEIENRTGGYGDINLYLELPDGQWYFFNYRNYIMQVIASDEGFNNELLNLKEDKRLIYASDEESPYEFVISSRRKMVEFKRKMEEIQANRKR